MGKGRHTGIPAPTPAAAPNRAVSGPTRRSYADVLMMRVAEESYSSSREQLSGRFLQFLYTFAEVQDQHPFYKAELLAMRLKESRTLKVYFDHLCALKDVDLIIATCNSQNCLDDWLLPAARQFLRNENFGNEATGSNETCGLLFVGFPASMQKLEDFWQTCPLVHPVQVFGGKNSILCATGRGRLLFEILMVAISKNHSKNISWDGTFNIANILIINSNEMKILKEPVKVEGKRLLEARVNDLKRAAEIFMPLYHYKSGDVLPIYFDQLKEDLEGATTELVAKEWFMEYLRYHVAIMPSNGRRNLVLTMYSIYTNCKARDMLRSWHKFFETWYPADWRTLVKAAEKDGGINVLSEVYSYNLSEVMTDPYDNTMLGLLKFYRNVLEHGGQTLFSRVTFIIELELYVAKVFSSFLPSLLRTLLEDGYMVKFFGDAWMTFKASQSDKTDSWSN